MLGPATWTPSRQQHGLWSPRCLPGPSPHSPSISSPCLPSSQPLWPPSLLGPRIPARGPHLTCAGSPGPGLRPISILEHHFLLLTPTNVMNRPCSSPCFRPPPTEGPTGNPIPPRPTCPRLLAPHPPFRRFRPSFLSCPVSTQAPAPGPLHGLLLGLDQGSGPLHPQPAPPVGPSLSRGSPASSPITL